jgi:hypothetical protein
MSFANIGKTLITTLAGGSLTDNTLQLNLSY